jgi:hypothetical protein
MPGLTLFRFRLTGRGWRIDREMGWGCLQSEADSAFLSRLKAIPFW